MLTKLETVFCELLQKFPVYRLVVQSVVPGASTANVTQLTDTNKCRWWFEDYPGSSYVRFEQRDGWNGYPVNMEKPISFDFVSAINYIDHHPELYGGKVVFLEKMDKATAYAEHRRLLDVEGIGHVTLDPRTIEYGPYRIVEDKRAILSQ